MNASTSNRLEQINAEIYLLLTCGNNSAANAGKWLQLHQERETLERERVYSTGVMPSANNNEVKIGDAICVKGNQDIAYVSGIITGFEGAAIAYSVEAIFYQPTANKPMRIPNKGTVGICNTWDMIK